MTNTPPVRGRRPLPPADNSPTINLRGVWQARRGHQPLREAAMPATAGRTGVRGLALALLLACVAAAVITIYIGLPLVLVANDLLHGLPNAVAAAVGLLLLAGTGISTLLIRTTRGASWADGLAGQRVGRTRPQSAPRPRSVAHERTSGNLRPPSAPAAANRPRIPAPQRVPAAATVRLRAVSMPTPRQHIDQPVDLDRLATATETVRWPRDARRAG
jgi:hypothetical protein